MRQSQAWKNLERTVAKKLGGTRVLRGADFSVSMGDIKATPGTLSELFTVECKYRKTIPALIRDGLSQAKEYDSTRLPLLVVKQRGMKGEVACLFLDDLVSLLEKNSD
jgi:hypothetical protein